jgi:1-aminocyclopropane-1-carboxylate deaminase/D-cysteine desulfhydrase-like pyridoxal-dependent ACC family enzyme
MLPHFINHWFHRIGIPTVAHEDAAAIARLESRDRQRFALVPTPLEPASRLSAALGMAARLLLKRDDYTSFAFGGNKVRKLEYVLTQRAVDACDVIITSGGVQSNHARVTAACAARLGKRCVLVLNGNAPEHPSGNALLQRLYGAEIVYVDSRQARTETVRRIAGDIAANGLRPFVVPLGASTPEGALGYASAAVEFAHQLDGGDGAGVVWVFISASSCGTLAGLLLGFGLAGMADVQLVGVSADETADYIYRESRALAQRAGELIGWTGSLPEGTPVPDDGFVGGGYGVPTAESQEAIALFARTEGCALDPVYTAKAAAALISYARAGRFDARDTVVFWHTGGAPALFA